MANIQAFCGLRYDLARVGRLGDVVAPPYDVIDSSLQQVLYDRHPHNVVRLILNQPEPGDDEEAVYRRAAKYFREWRRDRVIVPDGQATFYVYHQIFEAGGREYTRRGFMCRLRLEEFGEGHVYPHEETHAKAKRDRLLLTTHCGANMCPIFGIYPDSENAVQDAIEAGIKDATPVEVVDDAGVVHRMWGATDMRAISEGTRLMGPHPIFIADGHHRYETALNYRRALIQEQGPLPDDHAANYVLMCCVSMSDQGMIVLPTHRLFRGVPALDSAELASRLGESFDCEVIAEGAEAAPQVWEQVEFEDRQSTLGLFTAKDKKWTLARLTDAGAQRMASLSDHSEDWNSLGVSLLHTLIVENLLGLHELPSPLYVRKIEEVVSSLNTGDAAGRDSTGQQGTGEPFQFAAIVMPASVSDVEAISLNRERMPAKSTFFYPKMLSGLVFNPLK